ncbi:MAG: DNA repair protein RadC [Bacteroidota bacterium]|nr:DNA repair protein RadC [Bacteroidota bacterium]
MANTNRISGIKSWAEDDRPREKMLKKGKSALSDAELLAIIIGSGNITQSALDLSKEILNNTGNNLNELAKLSIEDLKKFKGIGDAKAISILATIELGGRRMASDFVERQKITCSADVYEYFKNLLMYLKTEEFWILMLNRANKIIDKKNISHGGTAGTVVDPKVIFKHALENGASSIVLCHNHPSGNILPSSNDINITKNLKNAGLLLEIKVFDHIIIAENKYYSFADEGII